MDQFCQRTSVPSISNDTPSGWVMCSGLMSSRSVWPGTRSGSYSPITGGGSTTRRRVDLEQLHGVHVDDELQPGHRVRVGVPRRRLAHPDVGPAQPAVAVLLRHQRAPVGPDVDQHEIEVGDARARRAPRRRRGRPSWRPRTRATRPGVKFGVTPGTMWATAVDGVRRRGRPAPRRCLLSPRSHSTDSERRGERPSPGRQASTSALAGSSSAMEANRNASVTPASRRSVVATCRNSSALSGSRGCWATKFLPVGRRRQSTMSAGVSVLRVSPRKNAGSFARCRASRSARRGSARRPG